MIFSAPKGKIGANDEKAGEPAGLFLLRSHTTLTPVRGGDEYSVRGDRTFDRVPLFDFDMSGVEFSIFYEDKARPPASSTRWPNSLGA